MVAGLSIYPYYDFLVPAKNVKDAILETAKFGKVVFFRVIYDSFIFLRRIFAL